MGSLVFYEARGEASRAMRGVLDVAENRAKTKGKTICQVVAEPFQFSWYKYNGVKPLDDSKKAVLESATSNPRVLTSEKFQWFYSGARPSWAKDMVCRKLGHLNFCKERT